tara:strand:- start:486 stop:821 length:336 start_codon:yes stop_codon:yes gene_type:complete
MAQLWTKIKLYCEANGKIANPEEGGNVSLRDDSDGKGPYIESWTVDGLTKPTDEQLASYETSGNTVEKNYDIRNTRRAAYGDIGDQLDEIYKDIDAWKARIKKIKDDNPKE